MKRAKIIVMIIILLLVLIVFIQNTEAVETKVLFMTITMPRVLMLMITFVLGFIGGLMTAGLVLMKTPHKKDDKKQQG